MRSGPVKDQFFFAKSVNQQPVRRDVTLPMVLPASAEHVISMTFRQHLALLQLWDQSPQQFHLLAAALG